MDEQTAERLNNIAMRLDESVTAFLFLLEAVGDGAHSETDRINALFAAYDHFALIARDLRGTVSTAAERGA